MNVHGMTIGKPFFECYLDTQSLEHSSIMCTKELDEMLYETVTKSTQGFI